MNPTAKNFKKSKVLVWVTIFSLALSPAVNAGWFSRDPDPDPKPNFFRRMGRAVTAIFHKKDRVQVSASDVKALSSYSAEEWVSEPPIEEVPQVESPRYAVMPEPDVEAPAPRAPREEEPLAPVIASNEPAEKNVQAYVRKLKTLILKKASLPPEAKGTGLKETVKVYFVLNADGTIQKAFIPEELRSSFGYINEAAIATVQEASLQFPPLPEALAAQKEPLFNIEITYEDTP